MGTVPGDYIRIFSSSSIEYKRLEYVAAALSNHFEDRGIWFTVDDIYFDYRQDWEWTTIIKRNPNGFFQDSQALYPAIQERIVDTDDFGEIIHKLIEEHTK